MPFKLTAVIVLQMSVLMSKYMVPTSHERGNCSGIVMLRKSNGQRHTMYAA